MVAYMMIRIPQPGDVATNQVATIYESDGSTVLAKVVPPEGNRVEVDVNQIPQQVRNAVIAAEDRKFYTNPGFSITGTARAAINNVTGGDTQGGSTITQQYVKNAVVGDQRTIWRKMKELVISAKMARQWSKDEIMGAYLNTIYFGRGAYGIGAASKAYFNKPVQDLTVGEGAVLASSIRSPSNLDPATNPEGAKERWNYVLDGMVKDGSLSQSDRANLTYPQVLASAPSDTHDNSDGPDGLIKTQVLKELEANGISEQDLNTRGLQITTTIDPKAQASAVKSVHDDLEGERSNVRTAVVSVDPRSGAVRAYYGGDDGHGYDYANAGLQSGSTFKVFGLAAMLAQGRPVTEKFDASPLTINGVTITNADGEQCTTGKQCTAAQALKQSLNTVFYRLMLSLNHGAKDVADMAHAAGIPKQIPGVQGPSLQESDGQVSDGVILGQYQVRPLDMAAAYATFADNGVSHPAYFVQKVVAADGQVLLDRGPNPPGTKAMDAAVADNVVSAMKPIAAYSHQHQLAGGRQSASKTGTTQLGDTGQNKDAWMIGFTPSLSTAVWVGTADGVALKNPGGSIMYGSQLPSDIWKDTMDGALEGTSNEKFPEPAPIDGVAGVPEYVPPTATYKPKPTQEEQAPSLGSQLQSIIPNLPTPPTAIQILPGVTIPIPGQAHRPSYGDQNSGSDPSQGTGDTSGTGGDTGSPGADSGTGDSGTGNSGTGDSGTGNADGTGAGTGHPGGGNGLFGR
ncbi:penicillin-binding protein [Rhodococcus sp. D2-41]|nr:penicillin-binding protein [Rhodococcus sp. D2-41]